MRAPVSRLLFSCGPSTVTGLVVAFVVDAINRVGRGRPRPHRCEKGFERFPPFCADRDSACTVVAEAGRLRVVTAADHVRPDAVLGGSRPTMRGASRVDPDSLQMVTAVTAARSGTPAHHLCLAEDTYVSTGTPALPKAVLDCLQRQHLFQNRESIKHLAYQGGASRLDVLASRVRLAAKALLRMVRLQCERLTTELACRCRHILTFYAIFTREGWENRALAFLDPLVRVL